MSFQRGRLRFRGAWFFNIIQNLLDKSLSFNDAVRLVFSRFKSKPTDIEICGLRFKEIDHIDWSIIVEVFVEQVYAAHKSAKLRSGIVLDIGAHRGIFTGFAVLQNAKIVHAFEPDPYNLSRLKGFLQDNKMTNVIVHEKAVSSEPGMTKLYRGEYSSRHTISGKDQVSGKQAKDFTVIETVSLDEIIAEVGRVDFVKMDCEGLEAQIVMAAGLNTLKSIGSMAIEYHYSSESEIYDRMVTKLQNSFPIVSSTSKAEELGFIFCDNPARI